MVYLISARVQPPSDACKIFAVYLSLEMFFFSSPPSFTICCILTWFPLYYYYYRYQYAHLYHVSCSAFHSFPVDNKSLTNLVHFLSPPPPSSPHYSTNNNMFMMTTNNVIVPQHQQQQQQMSSGHSHHHHHHHNNNKPTNPKYSSSSSSSTSATTTAAVVNSSGQIQVNAMLHHPSYGNLSEGGGLVMSSSGGDPNGDHNLIDHMPMYSNVSQSRDAATLNDHVVVNQKNDTPLLEHVAQVVKQPVMKTNSDGGGATASSSACEMSRIYTTSRDGKYNSRGQRLHRTIPRHFTTSVGSVAPMEGSSSTGGKPSCSAAKKESSSRGGDSSTLRRNKSERALSAAAASQQNKKPVCQCPIQHVPMTYMGSTTLSSNQLLASNVTGATKLVSNHHHKSMFNVAKQQQHHQNMVLEPAQGFDDELKLVTNSLRRLKTRMDREGKAGGGGESVTTGEAVKIPTISKQVLNTEKRTEEMMLSQRSGGVQEQQQQQQQHPIQSILKRPPAMVVVVPGQDAASSELVNNATAPPPFPLEMIDSVGSKGSVGASGGGADQQQQQQQLHPHPALPPKMYKTNRHYGNNYSIPSISTRMSVPQGSSNAVTATTNTSTATSTKNSPGDKLSITPSSSSYTDTTFQTATTYCLAKTNSSALSGNSPGIAKGSAGRLSQCVSKVPSVVNVAGYQSKAKECQPGTSKSVGESHYNHHQQSYQPHHHHQQPKNAAKPSPATAQLNVAGTISAVAEDNPDKPLPVCTTSKNCANPREHFMPTEGSLDDDYLSECENCKSVYGSRYYLEEQVPESPQETMTLQRKPEVGAESEEQAYRTSSTLPSNTKQKNT